MKNLWISSDGDLVRQSDCSVVRSKYRYTFAEIKNSHQLRATIRNGAYAWPGGYPMFLLFGDGEPCCFHCARAEYVRIARDTRDGYDKSFQIVGCSINYEDSDMQCAHCNERIESAYGEVTA